jgi:putative redox protein
MSMTISFPGGVAVNATFKDQTVRTDQPVSAGGAGSAMAPFDLFLASIGTCMGFYALRFCQERSIDTNGLGLTLDPVRDETQRQVAKLAIRVVLPERFPEKYREAMLRAVDHCAVKRHIVHPPAFEIELVGAAQGVAAR